MSESNTNNIDKASEYWDENLKIHKDDASNLVSWLDSPVVLYRCLNKLEIGSKRMSVVEWLIWVQEKYIPSKLDHGLSVGCGDGTIERSAIGFNMCAKMDAYDISGKSIEIAHGISEGAGLSDRIKYEKADINNIILEENKYDIIFAGMSMHHFTNLEHIFEEFKKTLKPDGLLVINEFVGPNQFQWTEKQLSVINELLNILPEKYRHNTVTGQVKEREERSTIECMNASDPSEAIRSSDIIPVLSNNFHIVERVDWGGTILHMLLHCIMANFDSEKEEDVTILRLLGYIEDVLIREKVLESDFALIVARNG